MASLSPAVAERTFFARDLSLIVEQLNKHSDKVLHVDVAKIIAEYLVSNKNPFGAAEWKKYWKANVGEELGFTEEFYEFWNGPDPFDPTQRASENHFVALGSEFLTIDNAPVQCTLQTLGAVGFKYAGHRPEFLSACANNQAGPNCWLVMRRPHIEYHLTPESQKQFIKNLNAKTGANYEEESSIIDLARAIFADYASNGNYLGTEKHTSLTYCKEDHTLSGRKYKLMIGGDSTDRLYIDSSYYAHSINAIIPLRKFKAVPLK